MYPAGSSYSVTFKLTEYDYYIIKNFCFYGHESQCYFFFSNIFSGVDNTVGLIR